jgi:hypothetical protein
MDFDRGGEYGLWAQKPTLGWMKWNGAIETVFYVVISPMNMAKLHVSDGVVLVFPRYPFPQNITPSPPTPASS